MVTGPLFGALLPQGIIVNSSGLWCDEIASGFSPEALAADSIGKTTMMAQGTVKWFNPTKGYGFIQPGGGGRDVFVHISAVERAGLSTLNEGQTLEFEVVSNRGKESAENLKVR
jgi:CspA family cold shock protein